MRRHLYLHAKTAGYLYQAQLRAELTRRLGVEWTSGPATASPRSSASPTRCSNCFATRSDEIEGEMASRGVTSARAAQYAALETRQAKDYDVDPAFLPVGGRQQAADVGFQPDECPRGARADRAPPAEQRTGSRPSGLDWSDLTGCTAASTFDRRDVLRAWCEALARTAPTLPLIEQLADQTLADPAVVALQAESTVRTAPLRSRTTGRPIERPAPGRVLDPRAASRSRRRLVRRATSKRRAIGCRR